MSIVGSAKAAAQGAVQAVMKKGIELAPDSWLPGGKPDPLIRQQHGLVGAPISRIDGPLKVQGRAKFAAEFPIERMAYAALAFSTIPKGRIATLDTVDAEAAPGVVLVGLHLSDVNSIYLVGQLIDAHDCGVVVLSGAQSEAVRIDCLEVGADDYLPQGSTMRDMVARIRAVHRRVNVRGDASHLGAVDAALVVGPVQIDRRRRCVHTTDGQRLNLTSAEYGTLETLAQAAGGAVSRDRLSEAVLRRPWRAEDRSVDQLVLSLRQKLPTDVDGKHLIQSIRGSGYWLRAPNRPTLPFMKASSG